MRCEFGHRLLSLGERMTLDERLADVERITLTERYDCYYWRHMMLTRQFKLSNISEDPFDYLLSVMVRAQKKVDEAFYDCLPHHYALVANHEGDLALRWRKAAVIGSQIRDLIKQIGVEATVDGRVKSYFSLFKKTQENKVDLEEIFDKIGIRVLVQTEEDKEKIKEAILSRPIEFRLKPSYKFRYRGDIHVSERLIDKPSGYKALHLNLFSRNVGGTEELFELQIQTMDDYLREFPDQFPSVHALYKIYKELD